MNASYVYGLSLLKDHAKRAVGALTPYETFRKATATALDDFDEEVLEEMESGDEYIVPEEEVIQDSPKSKT